MGAEFEKTRDQLEGNGEKSLKQRVVVGGLCSV